MAVLCFHLEVWHLVRRASSLVRPLVHRAARLMGAVTLVTRNDNCSQTLITSSPARTVGVACKRKQSRCSSFASSEEMLEVYSP